MAISEDHGPLVKDLIETPFDHEMIDSQGRTLLHLASLKGSIECIHVLVDHGFGIHALDMQNRTHLHHAAMSPISSEGVHYFLSMGLDPQQMDVDGWTPLLWAIKNGLAESIEILSATSCSTKFKGDDVSVPATTLFEEKDFVIARALRPMDKPLPLVMGRRPAISFPVYLYCSANKICDGCETVRQNLMTYVPVFCCTANESK